MTSALVFAVFKGSLSAANLQLILGILLAISEVLGADPRVKSNGIVSFVILQLQNFLRRKNSDV